MWIIVYLHIRGQTRESAVLGTDGIVSQEKTQFFTQEEVSERVRRSRRHTAFCNSIASILVAGFVFQILGSCDLFFQEGAPLFQLLQRNLTNKKKHK